MSTSDRWLLMSWCLPLAWLIVACPDEGLRRCEVTSDCDPWEVCVAGQCLLDEAKDAAVVVDAASDRDHPDTGMQDVVGVDNGPPPDGAADPDLLAMERVAVDLPVIDVVGVDHSTGEDAAPGDAAPGSACRVNPIELLFGAIDVGAQARSGRRW